MLVVLALVVKVIMSRYQLVLVLVNGSRLEYHMVVILMLALLALVVKVIMSRYQTRCR